MSTFSGISAASSALQAQRKAMDVTGENIANVNTPGYTRQRINLAAAAQARTSAVTTGGTSDAGAGVSITGIDRLSNAFWTSQVNTQTSLHADLAQRSDTLSNLEDITGEPSDDALSTGLQKMWQDWSNLSSNATSDAAKGTLIRDSQAVATTLGSNYNQVSSTWNDLSAQTSELVGEVNTTASTVASLNAQIRAVATSGGNANELMDQRDQAVTRLTELTGSSSYTTSNGGVNVFIGNQTLVDGDTAAKVTLTTPTTMPVPSSPTTALTGSQLTTLQVGGVTANVTGGQIAAAMGGLNVEVPSAAATYNAIAAQVASAVNGAIAGAYTAASAAASAQGITLPTGASVPTFFGPSSGSTITASTLSVVATTATLSAGVVGTKAGVATTVNGGADNAVASAVAALGTSTDATVSPDAAWKAYVADLGARSSTATSQATAAAATLANAVSNQQSESGVNMDEETSNLLVIQRAYQGAARVLTAVDQMLDTLINSTGMVGR